METARPRGQNKVRCQMIPQSNHHDREDPKFTNDEKKVIDELKQLYMETINLDVELQSQIYGLEKEFEVKHNVVFDKRKQILDDFKQQNHGDTNANENVSNFWLKVLKASYTEFISKGDEEILQHLVDVRYKLCNESSVKFILEFKFEPNDFIHNRVLTKTYFMNTTPDKNDPLSFDGAEIFKCEGCQVEWKQPRVLEKSEVSSFFDFFAPPELPDDPEDPNYCDINAVLQNDFELGFYLKERVIPKAIIFFTGEIADCQSSETESDSEDSEDPSDAEEEDDSSANEGEK